MKQPKICVKVAAWGADGHIVEISFEDQGGGVVHRGAGFFTHRRQAVLFARCLRIAFAERSMFLNHDRGMTQRARQIARAKAAAIKARGLTPGVRKKRGA